MVPVLISNEMTNVCVKANKVETTDFTYNLTFKKDNFHLFTLLTKLKGATFGVLNDAHDCTIIALPLEGWDCTEVSEDDYKQIWAYQIEHNAKRLKYVLDYEKINLINSRYLFVSYENEESIVTNNLIIKIKCTKIKSGIIANLIVCEDENEYFFKQGVKVTNLFKKYLTIDELYIGIAKFLMNKHITKPIQSIDELNSINIDF